MPKLDVVGSIIGKVADRIDDFTFDKQEKAELISNAKINNYINGKIFLII